MMIYLRVLIVFSSPPLTPPSLSAHLNNYYNPEECKLRGTNNGGKGKTLKNSFAFSSPCGIQTFILWSHPSFRDSNNKPLLHCHCIAAMPWTHLNELKCFKFQNRHVDFPLTFLNFPRSQNIMTAVRLRMRIAMTLTSQSHCNQLSDDHQPTDRKSLEGSNWCSLIIKSRWEYSSLIGPHRSRDLNTGLWLVNIWTGDTEQGARKYWEGHFWGTGKISQRQS